MINNVVVCADLQCNIDLKDLTLRNCNMVYNPRLFSGVQWKHKKVGGHCMLFPNGKMIVNGKVSTLQEAKRRLRRYARLLQKAGWCVKLTHIKVTTISASFKLEGSLNLTQIVNYYSGSYEPERFPAVMFVKGSVHFTCFHSGSVLMTGIKTEKQMYNVCIPVLIELPLL